MREGGACAGWVVVGLCALCACRQASSAATTCDEPVEAKLEGLPGQCQDAANARRPGAGDLCLASYMMTRDPATGARAARALQNRDGALPVIEWIAGAVGDNPAGADAWLATGLARYFKDDARHALEALQRASAHRAASDTRGRLNDATGLIYYYQHESDYVAAIEPAATAFELVDRVCGRDERAAAYLNIAAMLIEVGNVAMTEQVLERAKQLVLPTSRYYAYLRKLDAQIEKAHDYPAQTQAALRDALAFAIRDGNLGLETDTRRDLTHIALRHGALDKAAALLGPPLAENASPNDRAVDAFYRGWLADERGDHRGAIGMVERALATAPAVWTTLLEGVHARALLRAGQPERAERALVRAVDDTERQRNELKLDTFKSWLLAEQREPFEDLFLLYVSRSRLADALAVAQRATARSTLDGLLGNDPPPAAGIAAVGQHSATIRKLARALRESPTAAAPPIATVLERLRGNHVITYFRARRELWAIALATTGALTAHKIGDPMAIAARVAALRHDPDDLTIADELGAMLLPDEVMPPFETPIYVVTDEPIANLSFAALRRHGAFVLDHHPVAYAPSAAVLSAMRRSRLPVRALVLGDPTGDLPQAREEAKEVAARLRVAPRLGADATGAAVLGATEATLIHVAAHTEATAVGSALRLSDGLLDASAVVDHGITAGAIVLLTCSSAAITSRDELAALAAAFVAAGAHTVVASRWSVEDEVGRNFAKVFYEENGINDPVRAVAIAQRKLAARGVEIAQWSTFAVIGGLP